MPRTLQLLFRRDPSRDRADNDIHFEGYAVLWPDGRPTALGLDAFCKHGQRLLGLGKHLAGRGERLIELICFPLPEREANLTRLPGARVRRFALRRSGDQGRLYFLDGTPTASVFDLRCDEPAVLHWVGLDRLADGGEQWFDLAARPVESAPTVHVNSAAVHHPAPTRQ